MDQQNVSFVRYRNIGLLCVSQICHGARFAIVKLSYNKELQDSEVGGIDRLY